MGKIVELECDICGKTYEAKSKASKYCKSCKKDMFKSPNDFSMSVSRSGSSTIGKKRTAKKRSRR